MLGISKISKSYLKYFLQVRLSAKDYAFTGRLHYSPFCSPPTIVNWHVNLYKHMPRDTHLDTVIIIVSGCAMVLYPCKASTVQWPRKKFAA
jgi:hypothetical protein